MPQKRKRTAGEENELDCSEELSGSGSGGEEDVAEVEVSKHDYLKRNVKLDSVLQACSALFVVKSLLMDSY
jgi:hypothetical protein